MTNEKIISTPTSPSPSPSAPTASLPEPPSIGKELDHFIDQMDSLATALPLVVQVTEKVLKDAIDNLLAFLAPHKAARESDAHYTIPRDKLSTLLELMKTLVRSVPSGPLIRASFIVSTVSQFDAFLGRLLRCLFYLQPGLLNASERHLSFGQLLDLGSVEAAREYIIEKEIESTLRSSHADQFSSLETRFSVPLRKDLPIWSAFIEVTERRNLFVHCDGIVSSQYIKVCKEHNVALPDDVKLGKKLAVTSEYFASAYHCIVEIAVKLAHVLWRKTAPQQIAAADDSLIGITYELLCREHYHLAAALLDFAIAVLKKHSSEDARRIFIVNRAIVHKHCGKEEECRRLLAKEDWTACSDKFQLAVAVLQDETSRAVKIMKDIGKRDEVGEHGYRDWPLFKRFRDSEQFLMAYEQIGLAPVP